MDTHKIGYVVLHYQMVSATRNCVSSIQKILEDGDCIIIVDNGSPNGSGKELARTYQNDPSVEVVQSKCNLGFAKGCNLGFDTAKNKRHCNFIILLNNDTLIKQHNFRKILISNYRLHQYDVAGPMVLDKNGKINPNTPAIPIHTSLRRVKIGQLANYLRLWLSYIGLDIVFGSIFDRKNRSDSLSMSYAEDVQISGCCLIFTEKYIEKFDGLNPHTFMYLEEILLYIRVKKSNLKIAYDPKLQIIHLEDVATDAVFANSPRQKRRFKYRCQAQSFRVLLEEIEIQD